MSAFILFNVNVKNPEGLKNYSSQVPATLEEFGGSLVAKGNHSSFLEGDVGSDLIGLFSFPDIERAHQWYGSKAYQALIPQRDAAAQVTVVSYQA